MPRIKVLRCAPRVAFQRSLLLRCGYPLLLALVMLLVASGCSAPCTPAPPAYLQPPTLSLPNVRPVRGLDAVLAAIAKDDSIYHRTNGVEGLTTYQALGGTYALATLNPDVYALPLPDGPATRVVTLNCVAGPVALTADATRLACLATRDGYSDRERILVASFEPGTWPPRAQVLG